MADKPDNPIDDTDDVFDDNFDFDTDSDDILAPEEGAPAAAKPEPAAAEAAPEHAESPAATPAYHTPRAEGGSHSKKPLFYGIIGIAVIGLLAWKGFAFLTSEPSPKPKPVPIVEVPKPKPIPIVTGPDPVLLQKLEAIQKQTADQSIATQLQVKKLATDLEAANQNLTNTAKTIATLEQHVAALTGVVQNLTGQLQAVREEARKKVVVAPVKKHHHHPAPPKKVEIVEVISKEVFANPGLTVYAIIPGRAWLRDTTGRTLTVTEGDRVAEFGKVIKIDATNGIVVTSSGVTLR